MSSPHAAAETACPSPRARVYLVVVDGDSGDVSVGEAHDVAEGTPDTHAHVQHLHALCDAELRSEKVLVPLDVLLERLAFVAGPKVKRLAPTVLVKVGRKVVVQVGVLLVVVRQISLDIVRLVVLSDARPVLGSLRGTLEEVQHAKLALVQEHGGKRRKNHHENPNLVHTARNLRRRARRAKELLRCCVKRRRGGDCPKFYFFVGKFQESDWAK